MENKGKAINVIKVIWKIFEKVLMIVIVFITAIILTQNLTKNEKSFLGFRIFRVQTASMFPKYQVGDVILVKEKDINEITVGEDVTYWGITGTMKGKLITHQVVNIENIDGQKVFHTKGIANNTEDPLVTAEQINGVVKGKLHVITLICSLINNKYIFYFCGILPLTLFVFFSFIKGKVKNI